MDAFRTDFAAWKWENETRPQGASTPAASDHLPLDKNERG